AIRLSVPTPSSLREPDVPSPPVARSDFGQSVTASIDDLERLGEADSSGDVEQTLIEPPGLFAPPPSADDESAVTPAAPPSAAPEAQDLPNLGHGIKPLGQIRDSYIAATNEEGLLL